MVPVIINKQKCNFYSSLTSRYFLYYCGKECRGSLCLWYSVFCKGELFVVDTLSFEVRYKSLFPYIGRDNLDTRKIEGELWLCGRFVPSMCKTLSFMELGW